MGGKLRGRHWHHQSVWERHDPMKWSADWPAQKEWGRRSQYAPRMSGVGPVLRNMTVVMEGQEVGEGWGERKERAAELEWKWLDGGLVVRNSLPDYSERKATEGYE